MYKVDSYISGFAWHGLKDFLLQLGIACKVRVEFTNTTGWFNKTYYYTIHGEEKNCLIFLKTVEKTIDDFNKDLEEE